MNDQPPTKRERPLGLPIGSVRSLIVLILLVVLSIIALALTWRIVTTGTDEDVKEISLLVIGAIIGALASATAFYFKDRDPAIIE